MAETLKCVPSIEIVAYAWNDLARDVKKVQPIYYQQKTARIVLGLWTVLSLLERFDDLCLRLLKPDKIS